MTTINPYRKPRLHFDVEKDMSHVTFDDGKEACLNLPWTSYAEARWLRKEPKIIRVEMGSWRIILTGHNMPPLFASIEEQRLFRVRAQPALAKDNDLDIDTFVTHVKFVKITPGTKGSPRLGQVEMDLSE